MSAVASPLVTREDFHTAIKDGSIAALDAYFAQDHVRAEVDAEEAYISSQLLTTHSDIYGIPPRVTFHYAWYWTRPAPDSSQEEEFVFDVAMKHDQVEVIQWFFSPRRVSYMRTTLTQLLPLVAKRIMGYHNVEVLDSLLSSEAFKLLFPVASDASSLLDELASSLHRSSPRATGDLIRILLAHGSNVDHIQVVDGPDVAFYEWRESCRGSLTESQVDLVASEGMAVVGATIVSHEPRTTVVNNARRLFQLGGDSRHSTNFSPLHRALQYGEHDLARFLVEDAFADVDERDWQGFTPLMCSATCGTATVSVMASMLLERGSNVMLRDNRGRTALHHAVCNTNAELTKILLDCGADPNALDYHDESVLDCEALPLFVENWPDTLVLLLEHGMDPFAIEWDGESLFSILLEFEAGAAFVARHPQYFVKASTSTPTDGDERGRRLDTISSNSRGAVRRRGRGSVRGYRGRWRR